MKLRLFCVAVICGLATSLHAENLSKHLITKTSPDATVVFVKPCKMKKAAGTAKADDMEYDVTLSTLTDSVYITATVRTPLPINLDSVTIAQGDKSAAYPVEKLYVEPDGKKWTSRVRVTLPRADFDTMAHGSTAPLIKWGADTATVAYRHADKEWDTRRNVFYLSEEILRQNAR